MLRLTAILVVIGASAAIDFQGLSGPGSALAQPYYESHVAFKQVRLYLQDNVPVENGNFNKTKVQRHRVAGLLVSVTGALVEAFKNSNDKNPYDPLKVVDQALPQGWREYNTLAAQPLNKNLSEGSAKVKPVTGLIDSICITGTVEECNRSIQNRVDSSSAYLKRRAKLLLGLGEVSERFLNRQKNVEKIVSKVVSVLRKVRSNDFTKFVSDLSYVKNGILARNPSNVN